MTSPFHQKITQALADQNLQTALDGNAERRRAARQTAYASLPEDLQSMRQEAHTLRLQTIAELERYLEQFATNAQANGLIVHRAKDAVEAVEIVREIARRSGARLVAKSKTMVGEEIGINHALQSDGLQVIETDLGEYIVQLRGEPPSHIITPAVHLRRSDVGRLFQEKLGLPYTEDIPDLTRAARRVLRQVFLEADLGISGVNFGIAETGEVCVLTNEGNGRMVLTLPRVHVALMGIERLVPTLNDLALLLELLPRSATGQKLTVYASLVRGPRREGEVDGALERHVILVDNGRRALRGSPLREALYCIRCGACLNACPVFREIGGHAYMGAQGQFTPYSGPIGAVISPGLFGLAEFGQLARASSLCGACQEACPVDIDLPDLLLRIRAGIGPKPNFSQPGREPAKVPSVAQLSTASHASTSLRLGLGVYAWAAASPWRFHFAQRLAGLLCRLAAPFSEWLRLPEFTGWGLSRDFPRPALQPFHQRFRGAPAISSPEKAQSKPATTAEPAKTALQVSLRRRFAAELEALGGRCVLCTENELPGRVLELLQSRGAMRLQAWGAGELPKGLLQALSAGGIDVVLAPDPATSAGLTGALAGIAASGTLFIPGGKDRPQTASLLPMLHIALLRTADLYADLPAFFTALGSGAFEQVKDASMLTLVSGPSRTADIEMTLTIGVHGPGEVHVFCYEQV